MVVNFAGTYLASNGERVDRVTRAEVPPADLVVLGGGGEDVVVGIPDYGGDLLFVDARADLEACGGRG